MKLSESWLREWVNPKLSREELCHALTMVGLEVEESVPAAQPFNAVVVGQILRAEKHPEADQLHICEVDVVTKKLIIVTGAANIKTGMKVATALPGANLPDKTITATTIKGIASEGMLCGANELGLFDKTEGLLELPSEAPLGMKLWDYLELTDYTIDIAITPNRGDCLSVRGIAREVSALCKVPLKSPSIPKIKAAIKDTLPVTLQYPQGCPRYVGRVIRNVQVDVSTPVWLKERLRRSGIRSINPIVDVTNYVMLELGQPMHAFDLNTIDKKIEVRRSKYGEKITLLDGSEKELNNDTLIIADQEKPIAIAGVMGGLNSSVTLLTRDIFLESAYFSASIIAQQRQFYGLTSDSAYRFERGVDPTIQLEAIERATYLIMQIAGGEPGPASEKVNAKYLPKQPIVHLKTDKIVRLLGVAVPDKKVQNILNSLGFSLKKEKAGFAVKVPPYRSDVSIQEDLIEEIARLYGYDKIPTHQITARLQVTEPENKLDTCLLRQALRDQGYHEVITYSFIDKKLQNLLDPNQIPQELINPISADMAVMRTSLWSGLINTLIYNQSRQQERVRLFEIGTCFNLEEKNLLQQTRLAGLITGFAYPEQWGTESRAVDFFDIKGDVENLLKLTHATSEFIFKFSTNSVLHSGQSALIYYHGKAIGVLGALHPSILQKLDISTQVFVFELNLENLLKESVKFAAFSKFPEIRRDIAILVDQAIPSKDIQDRIRRIAGDWLKEVFVFDVYQGKGIAPGLKSIAIALTLQHPTRTLVDAEVAELMERVITSLKGTLGAELRS